MEGAISIVTRKDFGSERCVSLGGGGGKLANEFEPTKLGFNGDDYRLLDLGGTRSAVGYIYSYRI